MLCILITFLSTSASSQEISKEGKASLELRLAREHLIRIAESNMDLLIPSDSSSAIGWIVARENKNGGTQYAFLWSDTSIVRQISIRPQLKRDIKWKEINDPGSRNTLLIQQFNFIGHKARFDQVSDPKAGTRLHEWMAKQPKSKPIYLQPYSDTIITISCGSRFYVDKIPKSALPNQVIKAF